VPLDFPPSPPRRPRQPRQPKKGSGGGGGRRTVGMAIIIYGSAIGVAVATVGAVIYGHLVA
jgi:hypothetical protein